VLRKAGCVGLNEIASLKDLLRQIFRLAKSDADREIGSLKDLLRQIFRLAKSGGYSEEWGCC